MDESTTDSTTLADDEIFSIQDEETMPTGDDADGDDTDTHRMATTPTRTTPTRTTHSSAPLLRAVAPVDRGALPRGALGGDSRSSSRARRKGVSTTFSPCGTSSG